MNFHRISCEMWESEKFLFVPSIILQMVMPSGGGNMNVYCVSIIWTGFEES